MKPSSIAFALITGGTLLFATACRTDKGAYLPQNATVNDVENRAGFVLLDPRVQYSVTCSGIEQRMLSDGRMQVTANIRNRENRRIQVQVDCVFKDAHGFASQADAAPFHNLILTENAQEAATFVSMNDKAQLYTIRVREAH